MLSHRFAFVWGGGHGAYANPIFDNFRTIFCRTGLQMFAEHVGAVCLCPPRLSPCWALLGHIADCLAPRWVVPAA